MPVWLYFARPAHVAFHNLTKNYTIPVHLRSLLGLGLNYCLRQPSLLGFRAVDAQRFRRDIFTKMIFAGDTSDIPPLYARSNWEPNPSQVPLELRARTSFFFQELKKSFQTRRAPTNLLPLQTAAFRYLRSSDHLLVLKTDKNLGPAIMQVSQYKELAYTDHLSHQQTYRRLTLEQASTRIQTIQLILRKFISTFLSTDKTQENDKKYLERTLQLAITEAEKFNLLPISHFYLLAKIHKFPLTTRPIVSVSGSLLFGLGKWVDFKLQELVKKFPHRFPFYLSSSSKLVEKLQTLQLPPTSQLCTADAISMYTNIETTHALHVLSSFFKTFQPEDIHCGLLKGIEIIMRHCLFYFDQQIWVQLTGMAMGAPPAPMYATLYFAVHESQVMQKYANHILFYGRYIDDALLIVNIATFTPAIFHQLRLDFDNFGQLRWTFSALQLTVNFLDLTISLDNGHLRYTMYEKHLNLYLYIPPGSSHPPGVLKGLIFGRLHQINLLCSDDADKKRLRFNLYQRLLHRGYHSSVLDPIFQQSVSLTKKGAIQTKRDTETSIILHTKYHPCNPPSNVLQKKFYEHMIHSRDGSIANIRNHEGNRLGINSMIVAYHRPKNLGNFLSSRRTTSITSSAFPP